MACLKQLVLDQIPSSSKLVKTHTIWAKFTSKKKGGHNFRVETKPKSQAITLPETNIAPKNGWLEYDPFLLGFGLFSGAFAVSFREGMGPKPQGMTFRRMDLSRRLAFEAFEFGEIKNPQNECLITKHFRYLKWRNPHLYKLYVRLM